MKNVTMLHEHYYICSSEKCVKKKNNKIEEMNQLVAELEKNERTTKDHTM